MDPVLRSEYMAWKKSPSMEPALPFLARIYREDINPCLEFSNAELAGRVREAVHLNTLCISPVKVRNKCAEELKALTVITNRRKSNL